MVDISSYALVRMHAVERWLNAIATNACPNALGLPGGWRNVLLGQRRSVVGSDECCQKSSKCRL